MNNFQTHHFQTRHGLVAAAALILGLCALGLVGCNQMSAPAAPPGGGKPPAPPPSKVDIQLPSVEQVTDYEDFTGRTSARPSVDIRSRVTGYLDKILFTEGGEVQAGDVLFEIDPRPYQAELDRAQGTVLQAEAHLARLNLDLRRAESLLPSKSITREDYDRIAGDRAEGQASVDVAKAAVELAQLNLSYTKITAPISGQMSRSRIDPGNLVKSDDTILTTVVSLDPIYAYFGIDERLLDRVRAAIQAGRVSTDKTGEASVSMGLANEDGYPHPGKINFVDNRLDASTGTLQIRGVFPNPDHFILPELFARVRLPLGAPYDALVIPEKALMNDQGQRFVYIVNRENKIEARPVRVGRLQQGTRVILKGLEEGDRVVVTGLQRVRPGAPVDPQTAAPATASQSPLDAPATKAAAEPAKEKRS